MIRYFEVIGLGDEVEYFGFFDTSVDRVLEFEGTQCFVDYKEFLDLVSGTMLERLNALIPPTVKRRA